MLLCDRLRELRNGLKWDPEVRWLVLRHADELRSRLTGTGAIRLGDRFPDFELPNQHGQLVSSKKLLAKGPLVVSLFRGTWCSFCDLDLNFLERIYPKIRELGAELIAISPQSADDAREYLAACPVSFQVLVDNDARFSASLGLGYDFPEYLKELYLTVFNIDLANINTGGTWRLPIPGRLVVRSDGIVADAQYDPDYRYRPEPEEVLSTLASLRDELRGGSL